MIWSLLYVEHCAETSSGPISEMSPVVPVTIPDTGTAADTFFAVAEESIAALRKRDGTRSEPSASAMNVEVDLDATQVAKPVGGKVETRRRCEGDVDLMHRRTRK